MTLSKMPQFSLDFASEFFQIMRNFLKSFKIQTKYGTTAEAAASSVIISGISLVLIYVYTQRKKEQNSQRVFTRSVSLGALHGGKQSMKRLLQYHKMRATGKQRDDYYLQKFEKMIQRDPPEFPGLQSIVAKLEMRGLEDKAIEILKKAVQEAKEKSLAHHEYEYQMLLVEALIYKGDIEEAEKAECLYNEGTSDVRRSFYKAIIQLLRNNPQKAEEEWEKFKKMRTHFLLPPDVQASQFYKLVTHFQEFKQVVILLKKDIDEKKKKKKAN